LLLDKLESGILALETECGSVYVQASGWERLYLLWTFRHFNSLPLKTLNSRQRRLVQRLPRCSTSGLWGRPDHLQVIGTVEGATPPPFATPLSIEAEEGDRAEEVFVPTVPPALGSTGSLEKNRTPDEVSETPVSFKLRFGRSRVALMLATGALCAVAVLTPWHRLRPAGPSNADSIQTPDPTPQSGSAESTIQSLSTEPPIKSSLSAPIGTDLNQISSSGDVVASLPASSEVAVAKQSLATPAAISSSANSRAVDTAKIKQTPAQTEFNNPQVQSNPILATIEEGGVREGTPRIQVSGPPRRLVYPNYPQTNARGKVTLIAVIGADGKVREVKTVSGNKILSDAAARAIRQWRYDPYYKNGEPVETETNVRVSFVSADVISISFPPAT
jgi:TonB family protein